MCGSATLAMVVSTPCMIVAQVIDAVIAERLIRGPGASSPYDAAVSPAGAELRIAATLGESGMACNRRRAPADMPRKRGARTRRALEKPQCATPRGLFLSLARAP